MCFNLSSLAKALLSVGDSTEMWSRQCTVYCTSRMKKCFTLGTTLRDKVHEKKKECMVFILSYNYVIHVESKSIRVCCEVHRERGRLRTQGF